MRANPRVKKTEEEMGAAFKSEVKQESMGVRTLARRRKPATSTGEKNPTNVGEENSAYLLRQVAERLGISLVHALRPFDQLPSVYRVLIAMTRRNPVRTRDLIDLTLIEPSVLSRTVARMKAQGLLRVESDELDARSILIHATEEGKTLLDAMLPAVTAQYKWAIHDVPPEDLEVMRRTLQRILHNLRISPIK